MTMRWPEGILWENGYVFKTHIDDPLCDSHLETSAKTNMLSPQTETSVKVLQTA